MSRRTSFSFEGESITLQIPRSVLVSLAPLVPQLPETVTQDSVFALFGIRPKGYLAFARAGKFPNQKRGRLRIALYSDVRDFLFKRDERPARQEASANTSRGDIDDGEVVRLATNRMR